MKASIQSCIAVAALSIVSATSIPAWASEITSAPDIEGFVPTLVREQVRAELRQAIASAQVARTEADMQRLAEAGFQPVKTRPQVHAETLEAIRLGLIAHHDGASAAVAATAAQLRQIEQAGLRAADPQMASR